MIDLNIVSKRINGDHINAIQIVIKLQASLKAFIRI